jgi:hypothetical protein
MAKSSFPLVFVAFAACFALALPVFAVSPEVEAAIALSKQHHGEQCEKKKIQVQLLVAHQHHDQAKLAALGPALDAINQRLKPTEDKLNALKVNIKKNPDDQSAYESALLELGDCE